MSYTAQITKELNADRAHTRRTRCVMSYMDKEGQRHAKVLNLWDPNAIELMTRTIKWASYNGIEITFRPA